MALGLFTRPAAFFLISTMFVATAMHLGKGEGLSGASHAIELGIAFLGVLIAGGGRWSLDAKLFKRN